MDLLNVSFILDDRTQLFKKVCNRMKYRWHTVNTTNVLFYSLNKGEKKPQNNTLFWESFLCWFLFFYKKVADNNCKY